MFSLSLALLCIAMLSLFGMVILLPIYLQTVRGIESLPTGLMLLPGGLLMGLLGPTVGRLFDRYGPRALTTGGATVLTFTMWRFSTVDADDADLDAGRPARADDGGAGLPVHAVRSPPRSTRCRRISTPTAARSWPPCSRWPGPPGPPAGGDHGGADRDADRGRVCRELAALNGGISLAFGVAAVISIGAIVLRDLHAQPEAGRRPSRRRARQRAVSGRP